MASHFRLQTYQMLLDAIIIQVIPVVMHLTEKVGITIRRRWGVIVRMHGVCMTCMAMSLSFAGTFGIILVLVLQGWLTRKVSHRPIIARVVIDVASSAEDASMTLRHVDLRIGIIILIGRQQIMSVSASCARRSPNNGFYP